MEAARHRRQCAKRRGDPEGPIAPARQSAEGRGRTANFPDDTSNPEANRLGRQGLHTRHVRQHDAARVGERGPSPEREDATDSARWRFRNCGHYVTEPVGAHLKYLVVAGDRPVACFAWGSAPGALGIRDRFIGWSPATRQRNRRLLAANTRFLILPWVQVPHLASHLLGCMAARLSADWQQVYHHPIYWLETFIDPARFRGTCYRAANWIVLGHTTGRGHRAPTNRPTRPIKEVLGYPLVPDFRTRLTDG